MREILQFTAVRKTPIWGTEDWVIAAHENGDDVVCDGIFRGWTLGQLWREHRELFGELKGDRFPLLIKEICARDDLSIQVHPDDAYADLHENHASGKNECWYILEAEEGAHIIYGHNAKSQAEARQMIDSHNWEHFLRKVPVKAGDFFQIDAGTVHAIGGGIRLLEVQQNSDITYRLYDYDRLSNGKPRELHIQKALDVISYASLKKEKAEILRKDKDSAITRLVKTPFYQVEQTELHGSITRSQDFPFLCISIIRGEGTIDGKRVRAGSHLLLPFGYGDYTLTGNMTLITSFPDPER